MTYEDVISTVVLAVETLGAAIMVFGGLWSMTQAIRHRDEQDAYQRLRRHLGRSILLGLEVLIVADIIRTIVVDATVSSVLVLGAVVLIRILLSFSLEVEMDGVWPWNRRRLEAED